MTETETTQKDEKESLAHEPSEFSTLLHKEFKPKSDRARGAVENAVGTLCEYILKDT